MRYNENTLCGLFHAKALEHGESQVFLMGRFDGNGDPVADFRSTTWGQTRRQSLELAAGLTALGVKRGDKVAIFSESRPRWIIADQAIQATGGIEVPLYPTSSQEELAYMTSDSGCRAIVCSTRDKAQMACRARAEAPLDIVICMESLTGDREQGVYHFNEVMDLGRKAFDQSALEKGINEARPEDLVSIIYTSGTTGRPKGAMLTHANWIASMNQVTEPTLLKRQAMDKDLHLLFLVHLPICHVYGRTCDYHAGGLKQSGVLAFEPDFQNLPRSLLELRPNVIISIPRFFEKVFDQISAIVSKQPPMARKMFAWAMRQGEKFADAMARGERLGQLDLIGFSQANILVFNRVRKAAGLDRLVMAASGGGKLSREVCTFIRSMGIQLCEGYGLTETAAILNYNAPEFRGLDGKGFTWFQDRMIDWTLDAMVRMPARGRSPFTSPIGSLKLSIAYNALAYRLQVKPGTVGRTVSGTEEKIAEDGEILARGPQVFKGYWNMPQETRDAFNDEGWFLTGDIGRFDEDGFLEITDRKKELFVTSGGKNVAPHPIELAVTARPYIDQACLVGDGEKYLTALIVPDFHELKKFARSKGLGTDDPAALVCLEEVKALIQEQVDQVNLSLARYEQIKYYVILPRPFSVETGELTPTLKLKRRIIKERYGELIRGMYEQQKARGV
ncbi:MAG TPA: long-chain fatty acid--CoA ligase [Deltaproteobacteria bacterium]|nr:long-chain fatty acid--CoA ligase [Deltaproteobacteria bacterium]